MEAVGARERDQASDRPERTKPEHLHSSQWPLSSIRAAIKRTRTHSQCDHHRDRRRPEITIVSAEPLASNNWFPGSSVVFPPLLLPPPSPQSGAQTVSQPPPSYDQVIQEKTQQVHVVKPTPAPRRGSCTATSSTQTDPVRGDAAPAASHSAGKRAAAQKPQKPPRPSIPKPARTEPVAGADVTSGKPGTACAGSVTVHWQSPADQPCAESRPSSFNPQVHRQPVPLPRRNSPKRPITEEVPVQSLVRLCENGDPDRSDSEEVSSNTYLKELLEVFKCEEAGGEVNQSGEVSRSEDAAGEMNNSQRNIRARIQALESQAGAEVGNVAEQVKPEPRPRKSVVKPPVAAKPSVALKPQFSHCAEDDYQNVPSTHAPQNHQTPAPKPPPPHKAMGMSIKEELETLHKGGVPNRSRLSVLTRANAICEEEAPPPPAKPFKEPLKPNLNINNHNSASSFNGNEYVCSPSNAVPVEPQRSADSSRQSVTRRPTTIRVPNKAASFSGHFQDGPPPLPVQKPVGSTVTPRQSSTPLLPLQDSFQFGPEPSLPPRRPSTTKALPPRPPPAKPGPGRPPAPSLQASGRSSSASWKTSPKPQAQKPHGKTPVLPPRPNPGHRLYNKYTLELPHGIAASDYNGSHTGELSLQKNEVLLLLEDVDQNTFECQAGDIRGRVHKSRMKVITPLWPDMSQPQASGPTAPGGEGYGRKVQVIHDFIAEGPGELGLSKGDVVTMVEPVDGEWYRGTCRGSSGFFPINYVQVLSDSPKPLPERKPKPQASTASGPRCVARFDFEGEHADELTFAEGDVIQLKEYVGQDWARGQLGPLAGIFPLNFVEVIEDLPPPPSRQRPQARSVPLPGMVASPVAKTELAKPAQGSESSVVALYDYARGSEDELTFQQGDCILITRRVNEEWSRGRLNGREGMFPTAYTESTKGQQAFGGRARALFDYPSDCDEELSLQVGDIITNLESIDEEWFLGDLAGKRALVPKNYVQVLG